MLCRDGYYTVHSEDWVVGGESTTLQQTPAQSVPLDVCHECPPRGRCKTGNIFSLPNYWGCIINGKIIFLKCLPEYCYQRPPCLNYNTCNTGRYCTLCSKCKQNFSLALKSFFKDFLLPITQLYCLFSVSIV